MKKNNNSRPVVDDEDENLLKYCCPSASSRDMTGLIPYAADEESQMEAYNEMYPYLADDVDKTWR